MGNEITIEEIEKFRRLGLLNETAFRNMEIKTEFKKLRNEGRSVESIKAEFSIRFGLSESTLHDIIYRKSINKK